MPYSGRNPLAAYLQRRQLAVVGQVANGPDSGVNLNPVSEARADAVRAAWKPVEKGQAVPMVGEEI